jgi:hypothetical protein
MSPWQVTRERGAAGTFHGRPLPSLPVRSVAVLEVEAPALVLGSAQPESDVDCGALAAAGVSLVRRRSGGGAVLLRPGEVHWVDVVVPREDPLWDDDVGRAFHWLGRAWAGALADLGVAAAVHEGPLVTTRWSRLVCFAGLGPGELTASGAKVVGIAQRRTRAGARFQCAVLRRWDPAATTSLLALDDRARAAADARRLTWWGLGCGLVLGAAYLASGSLLLVIWMHASYNVASFTLGYRLLREA